MIKIIAGGKKNQGFVLDAVSEYQKRVRKPFDFSFSFYEEEKLAKYLANWPFSGREFVIVCDERGKNISSREYSEMLSRAFSSSLEIVILIGGAYGFDEPVREKADFVWSFSRLVLPHAIARVIVAEQTYRAEMIAEGRPYHHE